MTENPESLICISVIICDDVYRDVATQKLILVGVFNEITAAKFPCVHQRMCLLLSLTNGRGNYELSVHVQHEKSGIEVMKLVGPLPVPTPLAVADIDVRLGNLTFPEAGKYWVVVQCDGETIGQRPFFVRQSSPHPELPDALRHDQ